MNKIFAVLGISLVVTVIVIVAFANPISDSKDFEILTGTPADNFSESERDKFCGVGDAKSNQFVREYKIPTHCTQPQAITTDDQGNVWFAESNTGRLAKFNPLTESFTEYNNGLWPKGDNSMIWGLDYINGTLWFTDDKHDSVWKFDIATKRYSQLNLPILSNTLPQRLQINDSKLILNDFSGSQIIIIDGFQSNELVTYSIPSNAKNSVLADFAMDSKNNLWYTNWIPNGVGILARINQTSFDLSIQNGEDLLEFERFALPSDLKTPNGIAVDNNEDIWVADSSSSHLFKFDISNETFSKYTTFEATEKTFGNYTGQANSTSSNPYWIEKDSYGRLVFNSPGSNKIGMLYPETLSIIEYTIPSQNPNWGDCKNPDCGVSQVFDFTIDGKRIWFSEWAENNIGMVDTSTAIPIEVELEQKEIILSPGESAIVRFSINSNDDSMEISPIITNPNPKDLGVKLLPNENQILRNSAMTFEVELMAQNNTVSGDYFVLLGTETDQISVGKFLSVTVN